MTDNANKPDYFQFRWGVKEWDVGFTTIPNPVLKHYSKVAWIDKDGRHGCGITNQEVLCIIHIASFHYESKRGEARPAIPTVRQRMGYKKDDSISGLIKSLEHKNLLMVERKSGKCNVYSLGSFSQAIVDMDNPPIPVGGSIPVGDISKNPPIPVGDYPPIPVGVKNKTKEKKSKEEKKKNPDPLLFDLERRTLKNKESNYAVPSPAGGDDLAASCAYTCFCEMQNEMPTTKERQNMILELAETLKPLTASVEEIEAAFEIMAEDFQYRVGNYNVFQVSFKQDLRTCIARARGQFANNDDRRARDVEAMQESLAALEVRRAARPPPPQDDAVGQGIKIELETHMTRPTFLQYVQPTRFACEDGTLVITAPDTNKRDWLENRLGATIRRALMSVTDGPREVVFEVKEVSL